MKRLFERFQIKSLFISLILAVVFSCLACSAWAWEDGSLKAERGGFLTRGEKTLLLNAGAMGAIAVYGLLNWDYGDESFNVDNEGWFERTTEEGGADKLGHFWSTYAMSHLLAYIYRSWEYTDSEANLYGALSGAGIQTFMEIADGFSGHGFSYEDLLMNLAGAEVGYIWGKYPTLKRKIDFRIEYTPDFDNDDLDLFTNYEDQRFLMAVKADGFEVIKNPYLKYLEFHVGYFTRGYEDFSPKGPDDRRRTIYLGLGFNVSKLLQNFLRTTVLDYFQLPFTSLRLEFRLD